MTPILGQGLNCGLEDVIVLANVLEQHAGDVDAALPAYNHTRWPDVEALLNINEIVARREYTLVTKVRVLLLYVLVAVHHSALLVRLLPESGIVLVRTLLQTSCADLSCACIAL